MNNRTVEFERYDRYVVTGLYRSNEGVESTSQGSCWARSLDEATRKVAPMNTSELIRIIQWEKLEGVTTHLPKK